MRTVRDVMTEAVVVAEEQTPFKELVDLMHEHSVSAILIVDRSSRLIGVVSEADLLLKEARRERWEIPNRSLKRDGGESSEGRLRALWPRT
jgi:CBS-domain-containing membrane protein